MPAISLVVCVHLQRDLLERLIRESDGCYDELIVLHDIPDQQNIREVVERAGGRFFERPPSFLQEPHWPFAWEQAKNDWILRLDADEFPGEKLKQWLRDFRCSPEPPENTSGYDCIWPLWNGTRAISDKWPLRFFFFNKRRVRFFGMCEQIPVPDQKTQKLDLILHHQPPNRKIYGAWNTFFRAQSYRGREFIAHCLLGDPTDLVCWRWENKDWPQVWDEIRRRPLLTFLKRLIVWPLRTMRDQWQVERKFFLAAAFNNPVNHALICLKYWSLRRKQKMTDE